MKTLHTIYTNFAKRLAVVLVLLLTFGVTSVWGAEKTATLNSTCFKSNAANYQETEGTIKDTSGGEWKVKGYGMVQNTSVTLGKGNANYLQTPNFSGNISKIKVTCSGSYYLQITDNNGNVVCEQQKVSNSPLTFTVSGSYSQLKLFSKRFEATSNAATTITEVVVTYNTTPACEYTVQFNSNGGTGTMIEQTFTCDDSQKLTANSFSKTGYTFDGWNTKDDGSGDLYTDQQSVTNLTSNGNTITLYAQWTPTKYTITYNGLEGATHSNPTNYTIESETITFTAPSERIGYNFTGWNPASIAKGSTGNKTITAQWTEKDLTNYRTSCSTQTVVSFDLDGGSGTFDDVTLHGNTYDIPETEPNRDGYNFAGWKIQDGDETVYKYGTTNSTINNITESITLVAQWSAIEYTITYHLNGGSGVDNTTYTIESNDITLPTPEKQGLTFVGWYESEDFRGDPVTVIKSGSTGNKEFWAKWEKSTPTFAWSAATCTAALEADNTFPTLNNPNTLPVTYTSSNTDVATIDANGNITLVATGTTTITADGAETATHKSATTTYALTVVDSNCKWVEVEIGDIEPDDEVVVAMAKTDGTKTWALDNSETSTYPAAGALLVEGNKISQPLDKYIWNIVATPEGYVLYSYADKTTWLYCTGSNNTVKVGTGSDKKFVIENGYLKCSNQLTVSGQLVDAYIGVSSSTNSWRHYPNTTGVIAGQTLKLYKRECLDASKVWVEGNLTNVTCDPQLPQQLAKDGSITLTFSAVTAEYTLPTNVSVKMGSTNLTPLWNRTTGELTINAPTGGFTDNVLVTVEAVKLHTITWMVGSNSVLTEEVANATGVTKTPTDDPANNAIGNCANAFMGWSETPLGSAEGQSAPADLCTAAQMKLKHTSVTGDKTFYAVFATAEGSQNVFKRMQTLDELNNASKIAIINAYSSSAYILNTSLTASAETPEESSSKITVTEGQYWTLEKSNSYWKFKNSDNQYLTTNTIPTSSSKSGSVQLATSGNNEWVIANNTCTDNGTPVFTIYNASSKNAGLEYSKGWILYYSTDFNTSWFTLKLYIPDVSYSNYVTQCCTPWEAPTLSATTSIAVGDNTTITPNSGTTYGNVTYSSSDETIATVDANGKVTGVKPGKVTITATWDGVDGVNNYCPAEATIDVTVTGSFTITYDANHASATGATTATTIAYPTGQGTVATNGFALAEHQFVKWNTSADGSGTSYSEGASITLTDDITLYAIWQRYCTITYVIPAGGGTLAAGATTTVVAGGAVQMPGIENNSIDLEYSCEELIGWTTNSTTHEAAGLKPDPFYAIGASLSGITQNTTLYAVYSRAGNGLGGTVTLTEEEMYGWEDASYGKQRDLTTCVGTWTTTGYKSGSHAIQLRSDDSPYVKFPDLSGNITQVVLNATKGTTTTTLTEGTFTLKTEGGTTIASASVNGSGICTIPVTGSYTTAYLYSSATARITNIAITYGPPAIISTTLDCSSDVDECTITYDLNESFLAAGTQILGSCHNSTFKFSEVGTYTICSEPQANEYKLIGWNNQCDGKGSLTYTPGQEITSLPQNIITLYAQWAPEVIVHDSYEETKVYPTAMGGSITLNSGQYACDPKKYDFIGWTTDDPQLWQQNTTPPALLTDNGDGTVTFTPEGPSQVYAVYAIEDLANSDAFKLSSIVDGTKYYVGFNEDRNGRVKTVSTEAEALTFYKEETTGDDNYLISYIIPATAYNDPGTKQYLYYYEVGSTKRLQITTNPDVNQGWTLEPDGDGYKFRSIQYNSVYLSMTSGNVQTNGTGNVFNMETVAEYKYIAKTNCSENVTITFVPGNGTMTPSTNPVTAKTGDIITLPTCTYEGWTFLGWVTENIELTELEIDPSRLYTGTYEVGNSDVTLYAYYTQTPTPADFDGTTSGTWKMYTEVSTDVYKYALSHGSSRPATLSSTEYCPNATEWTFTNTGEANVYYIQDEDNLYLTPELDDTQLYFTSTPFPWKIVKITDSDEYRIYKYDTRSDDYNRLIMFLSGAFYHSAKANERNSDWHHVTIGGCQNPVYTTDPQPSKIISLVGSPMITSTIGQTVKASQKLQLVIKDMDANADVTIAADGLTFYDTDNNVVNTLQTGPNGSLTATFTVAYTPSVADNQIVKPTITITCGSTVRTFYNVACRSLPETFVIAAKTGNAWVALTANIQRSGTQEAELIQVDNITTPTKATITPNTTKYQLFGLQNNLPSQANSRYKNNGTAVHLYSTNQSEVISASTSPDTKTYINADATRDNAARSDYALFYEWQLTTNDLVHYTLVNSNTTNTSNTKLGYSATYAQWGMYQTGNNVIQEVLLLPIEKDITEMDVEVMEWGTNSMALRFGSEAPATVDITLGATTTKGLSLANLNSGNTSDIYKVEGLSLAGNDCEALLITDATDASKGKLIRKPILVSGDKKGSDYTTAPTRDVCMHSDIVILNGGKLTADEAKTVGSHVDFANIYVYPGGKLVLDDKSLGVKRQVYLRGGYSWLNSTYALPEVYVNDDINFNGSGNMIYDYYIQNQKYYQFALPYDVQLAKVTDESGADNFPVWVKHYNGALRAADANATSWEWYPSQSGDANAYFKAGIGYIIAAKPRPVGNTANRPLSIIRFPLGNTAFNGTAEIDKSVATIAHGIAGYKAGTVTANNVGWNFIGNPFMATWKGDIGHKQLTKYPSEENWDGSYQWVDAATRYITIMSPEDGSDYDQYIAANTKLNPFFPFYMQETADGGKGTITFTLTNRMKKAPAEILAAIVREAFVQIEIVDGDNIDQTGLYVSDKYSDDIDFDDLEKMFGTATDKAKAWFVHDSKRMAFESMTENRAAGSIPLGYRAPQEGTYTFTINEEISKLDCIENIYLTDYENGVMDYDLLLSDYNFESQSVLYNDTRFTVRIIMKEKGEGTVTGVDYIGVQDELPIKFIYQDKIFILHNETIYDATGKKVTTINK